MTTDFKSRRNEIIALFVTIIASALAVSSIANVAFNALYKVSPGGFLLVSTVVLVTSLVVLYVVVLYDVRGKYSYVSFPIAFCKRDLRFIDLPECPISVHSRVSFERLAVEKRNDFARYDDSSKFFGSEFQRFIDHVIQEFLLTIVFNRPEFNDCGYSQINFSSLPRGIKDNSNLRYWIDNALEEFVLYIPAIKRVQTFGRNDSFIRIDTRYGRLECRWEIAFCCAPFYSTYFITKEAPSQKEAYHDFLIELKLGYSCGLWVLLSNGAREFLSWASKVEELVTQLDWKSSQVDRLFVVLQGITKNT